MATFASARIATPSCGGRAGPSPRQGRAPRKGPRPAAAARRRGSAGVGHGGVGRWVARASGQDDKSSPLLMDENPLAIELRSRLQETQVAKKSSGEFHWLEVEGAYVRLPAGTPQGVVHFVGGALLGTYPQVAYDELLKRVCDYGSLVVIATPYDLDINHTEIAQKCRQRFSRAFQAVQRSYIGPSPSLPLFGIGHSLGSKLQALIACDESNDNKPSGQIFVSFNNFSATDSADLVDSICQELLARTPEVATNPQMQMFFMGLPRLVRLAAGAANSSGIDFVPSPAETCEMVRSRYDVPRTRVVKFAEDKIDQSAVLEQLVGAPCNGGTVSRADLDGNHLSPVFVRLEARKLSGEAAGFASQFGMNSELRLGDEQGAQALAMDIVSFIKGFAQ
mmetsp:Transcript_33506/g.85627  ORF Transcript_33506/g.85627 Transcript_33506/m.85627 type:complete len:393 (+) Transcript_33506:268-1446(+)